jgi:DUF1009 family protein
MGRIGLVVGSGNLPISILDECKKKNIRPFLILLKTFVNYENYKDYENISLNFGDVGKAISFFKKNNVKKIMFAGGVKKPNLKTIIPDFKGFFLLIKLLKSKIFGDDTILKIVIDFFEKEGFELIPIDNFVEDIKLEVGIAGKFNLPEKDYQMDIDLGVRVLQQIGDLDIGQSVIIQNGMVIGIECIEGTKELIERCGKLKYKKGRKPILVKIKKTNQTRKIDLPTIGEETIKQLKNVDFAGIAIEAKNTLVINKNETIKIADENKIFLIGLDLYS